MLRTFALTLIVMAAMGNTLELRSQTTTVAGTGLSQSQASHFAGLALKCISKEYPNKPEHVMNDARDVD
ncbi:MAG TPA: hypothetical protein VHR36_11275, partial [Pyrinomonadaceae bacterium]|nr:hypothetical protein [Pyrinomonadaceae bacterium]